MENIENRRALEAIAERTLYMVFVEPRGNEPSSLSAILRQCVRVHDQIPSVASLEDAENLLRIQSRDCLIIHHHDVSEVFIARVRASYPDMPIILYGEFDALSALAFLRAGAEDCIDASSASSKDIIRSVRHAMGRSISRNYALRLSEALERERELITREREFVALVTHEFRTPLAIINNALQLLQAKIPAETRPIIEKNTNKIERSIERLQRLIDNIILLSRFDEGRDIYQPSFFDIEPLLKHVCDGLYALYDTRIITWESVPDTQIYGDPALCEHILDNILSNALKYSPEDSVVRVEIVKSEAYFVLRIHDNGVGMSGKDITRMGEKFFRSSKVKHLSGTGLGMFLAHRLMEYHKGWIYICSEENSGTVIELRFPMPK